MKVRYSRITSGNSLQRPEISKSKDIKRGAAKKFDIVPFNQRIASAAKDKNLSHAMEQWDSILESGMEPTAHTYCAMINAFVRCGQLSRAEEFAAKMEGAIALCSTTREGFVITYTALLKGYFMSSAFKRSHELFAKIVSVSKPGRVGSRTLDTYLRGCLRTGALEEGLEAFNSQSTDKSDASRVYAGKMMAIRLAVKSASEVGSGDDPSVSVHIGCAYVRLGKMERATEWFNRAKSLLFSSAPERQFDKLQKSEMVRECDFFTDASLRPCSSPAPIERYIERFIAVSGAVKEQLQLWKSLGLGKYKSESEIESMARAALDSIRDRVRFAESSVVVEICSGSGEWIARAASAEKNRLFIASEFRFDRCVDILTRVSFQQLDNVWILCGDARAIHGILPERSVSELHVNYPEPPPVNNVHIEEEMSSDIVTKQFLLEAKKLLEPTSGTLKIVSDDKLYMQSIANVINDTWSTSVFPKSGKTLVDSYFARFFSKKAKRWSLDVPVPS